MGGVGGGDDTKKQVWDDAKQSQTRAEGRNKYLWCQMEEIAQ